MKVARVLVCSWLVGLAAPALAQNATDNDIVHLKGAAWRLHGIELPDSHQTCGDGWRVGELSRAALTRLTENAKVECKTTGKDQYSRPVASCQVDGIDLGAMMVREGMAWAALRHTWRYLVDDWSAWFAGAGLYGHDCEKPEAWRARSDAKR